MPVTNFPFLLKYTRLLEKLMFQELTDLGFAVISYSPHNTAVWWSLALVDQNLTPDQLDQIERSLQRKNRNPAIYFENREDLSNLKEFLAKRGYSKKFEDSWMFHSGESIDENLFGGVKKVQNEDDLEVFLETFNTSYKKDDPQNPYGELGDYLKLAEKAWKAFNHGGLDYFIVYDAEKPVAVATLNNFEDMGYISNVGSLPETRGRGFGKLATLYCVAVSKNNGNTLHCLATEEGTYPNEFYKRIGFKTSFTGICYSK